MRAIVWSLLFLAILSAAPGSARRVPHLEVEAEDTYSIRQPRLMVTIDDLDAGKQLGLVISVNGEEVGRRNLGVGRHRLLIDAVDLEPGRHVVEVRSGSLRATDELEVKSSKGLLVLGALVLAGLVALVSVVARSSA